MIAIKTDDGKKAGRISFYCRALEVSRAAFYDYLDRKSRPWKYQPLADAMMKIHDEDKCNDRYGRNVPKQAHGSENIGRYTSSTKLIAEATMRLFDRIVDRKLTVRRMYVVANHVIREKDIPETHEQLDLFSDFDTIESQRKQEDEELQREKALQKATIALQKRFGKNSVLKGLNLKEGATTIQRNGQIGGHKA